MRSKMRLWLRDVHDTRPDLNIGLVQQTALDALENLRDGQHARHNVNKCADALESSLQMGE